MSGSLCVLCRTDTAEFVPQEERTRMVCARCVEAFHVAVDNWYWGQGEEPDSMEATPTGRLYVAPGSPAVDPHLSPGARLPPLRDPHRHAQDDS